MKYPVIAFTRLLGAVALSTLLAACGSGGGGGDSGGGSGSGSGSGSGGSGSGSGSGSVGGSAVPSDIFRIACTVIDSVNAKPVEGALVTFNVRAGNVGNISPNTSTGLDGKCVLDVPAASVTGLTEVAGSVVKVGYETGTFTCPDTTPGTACNAPVVLIPLPASGNVSIPDRGDEVMHIGDGTFTGDINSAFQKNPDGPYVDFAIADWGTKLAANLGWARATVVLDAKGWQTNICDNKITMTGSSGSQILNGGNSDSSGKWSPSKFEFDVAQIGQSGSATLRISSGACSNNSADIDDLETNAIRVYFCNPTAGTCAP